MVIKLFPVISWLTKSHPMLQVPMPVPTHEKLGIAFAKDITALCNAVNGILEDIHRNGEFDKLQAHWFPK